MNDFTKEELNLINNALCTYLTGVSPIEMKHMQEKIQYMINNYCEHEYKKTLVGCFRNTCHKCQHSKPWDIAEELKVIE